MRTGSRGGSRITRGKADAFTSVVLTLPVFLLYHLGILFISQRNGVDWVSSLAFALLDSSVVGYVCATLGLCALLALTLYLMRRSGHVKVTALGPVLLESTGWAVLMMLLVGYATRSIVEQLVVLASSGALSHPVEKIVLAAGAGFHEEVAFRVVLFSGGAVALERSGILRSTTARIAAAIGAALIFAAVHHLGPFGEPFTVVALLFRTLAGLYLTAVYAARGFAVAVYTHAIYDLLVFFG